MVRTIYYLTYQEIQWLGCPRVISVVKQCPVGPCLFASFHATNLSVLALVLDLSPCDCKMAAAAPAIISLYYHIQKQK